MEIRLIRQEVKGQDKKGNKMRQTSQVKLMWMKLLLGLVSLSCTFHITRGQTFSDADYPWTYKCVADTLNGPSCQREHVASNDTTKVPLNICILTCGKYGGLWPYPSIESEIGAGLTGFNVRNVLWSPISLPDVDLTLLRMVSDADDIFLNYLKLKIPEGHTEKPAYNVVDIKLIINKSGTKLTLDTNESYNLTISSDQLSPSTTLVTITGETFFGVRHGLETLAQLIDYNAERDYFQIVSDVSIKDEPAFYYRGLLVDTGRNFHPLADLKRLIDGLSFNKMNIFHWHLTDSNSFPFYSKRVPQMVKYGTYSSKKIYYPEDVSEFLAYANQRGVKVIPEFDIPSHAGNGWQWGEREGLGELSLCVNAEPYQNYCIQPPCGQLNPLNNNTYRILGDLFRDLLETFDNDIFHMGGDEISFKCWLAYQEITDWMAARNTTDIMELWGVFQETALTKLKEANDGKPLTAIVWTSDMTETGRRFLKPEDYAIQIWSKAIDETTKDIFDAGYRVIFSNNDTVYLDHGYGPWRGNFVNPAVPIKTWQVVYANDLLGQVEQRVGTQRMEELYASGKIMGGVATLWSEKGDALNMDMKMWPRGAAYAERLWANPPVNATRFAYPRLIHHRERMIQRGIKPDVLLPEACYNIWGFCDNPY